MNILVDTSVFMSLFVKDIHFQKTEALFWNIIENHRGFFCSMSVNEMIWVLKRSECDKKVIEDKIKFVFSLPFRFLTPDQDIFLESIRIMEVYNLSFSDSVITAHAVMSKLKIATLDRDFKKVPEIEVFGVENAHNQQ